MVDDTLPEYVKEFNEIAAFLHIDSDLYSSARSVFQWLDKKIVFGL